MAEQQLLDYIQKAREAGQLDDQSRDLLVKNGWTNAEINEAIMALTKPQSPPQTQPAQPQPVAEPPVEEIKPELQVKAQPEPPKELPIEVETPALGNDFLKKSEEKPQEIKPEPIITKPEIKLEPVVTQPEVKPVTGTPVQNIDLSKIINEPEIAEPPIIQPEPITITKPQPQAQAQPQYKPQFAESAMPRMRSPFFAVLKSFMILIMMILIAGTGYFALGQYISLPYSNFILDLFQSNPELVINNMMTNMQSVKSYHTIIQAEINATNNKISQGNLIINANSETDSIDPKNIKADGNFTVNLTTPASAVPTVSSTISLVSIGNTYYVKINDLTIPSAYLTSIYPGLDISQIKGKWLSADQNSVKTLQQSSANKTTISTVNTALNKQVNDLIKSENLFANVKQLSETPISGQSTPTYHYLITIKKEKLQDLITKLIALGLQQETTATTPATSTAGVASSSLATNLVQAYAKTFTDALGDISIETWIGKSDYMLYQVKIDKAIDLSKILGGATGTQAEVKFSMTNSNFNKPITIQAPAGSQKIENVILPLLKTTSSTTTSQGISADMQKIASDAEALFARNQSYALLCKSNALNGAVPIVGADLINSVRNIIKQGAKNISCLSNTANYCFSAQQKNGSYVCVGTKNTSGTVKCTSAGTICK